MGGMLSGLLRFYEGRGVHIGQCFCPSTSITIRYTSWFPPFPAGPLAEDKDRPIWERGEHILGKTGQTLCPVTAVLNFILVRQAGVGPLLSLQDGTPLTKDLFVRKVRKALTDAQVDQNHYSGHSFRIGAATAAAAVGIPAHVMGRWTSEAYQLYIHQPRESLASLSARIAAPPAKSPP